MRRVAKKAMRRAAFMRSLLRAAAKRGRALGGLALFTLGATAVEAWLSRLADADFDQAEGTDEGLRDAVGTAAGPASPPEGGEPAVPLPMPPIVPVVAAPIAAVAASMAVPSDVGLPAARERAVPPVGAR